MSAPVLRFAPSPTGFFHVGGARTALWNWLVARRTGGRFILRIEDTDLERNREHWVDGIRSALSWLGLDWDLEVRQSERAPLYAEAIGKLRAAGRVYECDCARAAVVERNTARFGAAAESAGYDGFCRDRGLEPGPGRVTRFRMPAAGTTTVRDLIRGEPIFDNAGLDDLVLARADGTAVFLLANVVDDIDLGITHVVRGEEHLPNTPKAILLWQALAPGVPLPVFAHVPVLVNEQRKKLSKRRDKVALESYRDMGILAEAMRAYLCQLGWTPNGDRERLTLEEMTQQFRLEEVSAAPAFFDLVKLTAFNAEQIRELSPEQFALRTGEFIEMRMRPLAPLIQERVKLLADVPSAVDFFFAAPTVDQTSWDKVMSGSPESAVAMVDGVTAELATTEWSADALKGLVERVGAAHGLKLGKAQAPIRVALTGRTVGPPLFESMELLGREVVAARLAAARARLE
jgi:glutamyl-tRNA synthetase